MTPAAEHLSQRVQRLRARLDQLANASANFWLRHGPDAEHGGFHATLNEHGAVVAPTDKGLIQQARHLWSLSVWFRYRDQSPAVRKLAEGTYDFMMTHLYDP